MVCSCAMSSNFVWLQIMRKWHHAFLLFAIAWQIASLPEDIPLNKTRWSNDKTVIVLGYRKISWFVSVSRCFAQPLSNNCKLPITNPSLLILAIIAPVSGYGTDDIEKAKCGYATCLCDMEMIRCFKHYKEDLDLDKHHGWEILQKKSCAFKGNIFFMIKGFYIDSFKILCRFYLALNPGIILQTKLALSKIVEDGSKKAI